MTDYLTRYDQAVKRNCYVTLKNGKVVNKGDLMKSLRTMASRSIRDEMRLGALGRTPHQLLELVARKVPEPEYDFDDSSSSSTIPIRGYSFIGVSSESEDEPDLETLAETRRENPQTAAYLRAFEEGTPLTIPPSRPAGMPIPEGVTPNPLVSRELGMLTELVRNLEETGQYLFNIPY